MVVQGERERGRERGRERERDRVVQEGRSLFCTVGLDMLWIFFL